MWFSIFLLPQINCFTPVLALAILTGVCQTITAEMSNGNINIEIILHCLWQYLDVLSGKVLVYKANVCADSSFPPDCYLFLFVHDLVNMKTRHLSKHGLCCENQTPTLEILINVSQDINRHDLKWSITLLLQWSVK